MLTRSPASERLLGVWDTPTDELPVALGDGGEITLSGWALSPRRSPSPIVTVYLDGLVQAELSAVQPRPDVAAIYPDGSGGGWSTKLLLGDRPWASLEVVAKNRHTRRSLGIRYVEIARTTPPDRIGRIDLPVDGDVIRGGVVDIRGWSYFAGSDTDCVDVFADGQAVARARRCDARPDLASIRFADGSAMAGGFSELLPLKPGPSGRTVRIHVRALAGDGRSWESEGVTVRLEADAPEPAVYPALDPQQWTRRAPPIYGSESARPSIGVFTHSLSLGGGELYLQELLVRLAADRFADILVITQRDGPLRAELEAVGIAVHIVPPYVVDPEQYARQSTMLAALLKARGCTVVLANTVGVFPAVDAALVAGYRVIWAIHESFPLDVWVKLNWGGAGLAPAIRNRMIDALDQSETVFEAEATLSQYKAEVGGLNGRHIRYGVNLSTIAEYRRDHAKSELRAGMGFFDNERILLCMGVVQERKAQLALVCAFAQLCDANPTARLVLVGDHPTEYSAVLHDVIEAKGLADRVSVLPIDPDIYQWYMLSDVMISASDVESLPRSVLEAMAFGLPTLATDVFGLAEVIVDGINGWLCRSRSGTSLVAGLKRVLGTSMDDLRMISERCIGDSLDFDGQGYANAYKALILTEPQGTAR